jgi:uncharacterized protein YdhG (YjbR/CyaY superfamily)
VPAARDRRQECRLVDHDEPLVAVQHVDRTRDLDLLGQVTVEPHERVGRVGMLLVDGFAVVVDEAPVGQHPGDVDPFRQAIAQPGSHRRPRVGGRLVAVGRTQPRSTEPVTRRQRRARRHLPMLRPGQIWSGIEKRWAVRRPYARHVPTHERGRTMAKTTTYEGFTEAERDAMKERAAELKKSGGKGAKKAAADDQDALDKIAEMPDADRVIAETLYAIVREHAPDLAPKTWYGMPAFARDGKVVVFFKPAAKFKVRYAEVGFNEWAQLDDGDMWPTAFAVIAMNPAIEKKLTELVTKAAG